MATWSSIPYSKLIISLPIFVVLSKMNYADIALKIADKHVLHGQYVICAARRLPRKQYKIRNQHGIIKVVVCFVKQLQPGPDCCYIVAASCSIIDYSFKL